MQTLSVSELKGRVRDLGLDIPPHVVEKSDLLAFLQQAEADAAGGSSGSLKRSAYSDMKIADLKARLKKLGLAVPTTIVEKKELAQFVEEAEREFASNAVDAAPAPVPSKQVADTEGIPWPWYKKESRSKPGKFYYVNANSGATCWEMPAHADKSAPPVEASSTAAPEKSEAMLRRPSRKHDYRDDAFKPSTEEASDALEKSWSRDGKVTCEVSEGGVKSINVSPKESSSKAASRVSENTVTGDKFSWVRGEMIGRGALGRVFKALDQSTGQLLAVKEVLVNCADEDDNKFIQDLKNEVDILQGLQHPHIVRYLGHDYIDSCLYMYLEHMAGGTVTQALQQFGVFEEILMADYSKQVLQGLEYLHTRDPPVVHRDIKGSNILLGLDRKAKLADFGCSRQANHTLTHTMRGSVPWMAPEVIAFSRFGRSADIWSFACFVIEMGTASVPWGRFDNQMAALLKIGMSKALPKLPEGISEVCKDFIQICLQREAEKRPSATELLNHNLLKVTVEDF